MTLTTFACGYALCMASRTCKTNCVNGQKSHFSQLDTSYYTSNVVLHGNTISLKANACVVDHYDYHWMMVYMW